MDRFLTLLFFVIGARAAMLLRPFVIVAIGCCLWNAPAVLLKAKLAAQGLLYMLFCNDKKWKKPEDPAANLAAFVGAERKTIVFVRHGESTWNDTFNKGERKKMDFIIGFIPGLIKSTATEIYLLLSGQIDSWFYDAPLSDLGISQIDKFAKFLAASPASDQEAEYISLLAGGNSSNKSSVLVSSNLRRALSTVCIGFRDRLANNLDEKIVVTPTLQEISRNPDTLSITPPHNQVTASWIESASLPQIQPILTNRVDMSAHTGNKSLNTNGLKRMSAFCEFAFERPESALICGGHSLWFRSFFQTYLPYSCTHKCKKLKMVNGGAVCFELLKGKGKDGKPVYMIEEKSVYVIYGGF
tara:strand:- start:208 stop:1275 length:1068 start_codon:yes stop_codon:yes gene_type:complete